MTVAAAADAVAAAATNLDVSARRRDACAVGRLAVARLATPARVAIAGTAVAPTPAAADLKRKQRGRSATESASGRRVICRAALATERRRLPGNFRANSFDVTGYCRPRTRVHESSPPPFFSDIFKSCRRIVPNQYYGPSNDSMKREKLSWSPFCGKTPYLAAAASAREVVALAVLAVEQFLRVVRPSVAVAHAALACAVTAADLVGLVVGLAVGGRDRIATAHLVYLALALLPVKVGIAGAHAAHRSAVTLALRGVRPISLFHE